MKSQRTSASICRFVLVLLSFALPSAAATRVTCETPSNPHTEPTEYFVSLADAATHTAHVTLRLPEPDRTVQLAMPVWNALYQVRNFVVHVENVRAQSGAGFSQLSQSGTSKWDLHGASGCSLVSYDVYLDVPGPFGSELDAQHGFFNWAMVLMYSPDLRGKPVSIRLLDVPPAWELRDTHVFGGVPAGKVSDAVGLADDYDSLIDSPADLGTLQQYSFEQGGATYHIVVQGNPADYDSVDSRRSYGALRKPP